MNANDLADLVRVRGHQVRVRRNEVVFRFCLFCGNERWNLEASATKGVYHCWAGSCSGTVADLLSGMGVSPPAGLEVRVEGEWSGDGWGRGDVAHVHIPGTVSLDTQPSAMRYLEMRGVDEATARWLGVMVQTEGDHTPRLVVPVREFWVGYDVGYVTRGYGPAGGPKYMNYVQCHDSLPGWRDVNVGTTVVVEGVFDALAVRRAGYSVAMLLGLGRRDDALRWASLIPQGSPIVLLLDPEARSTAQALANEMKTVHRGLVAVVELPEGTDPGGTAPEDLRRYVTEVTTT